MASEAPGITVAWDTVRTVYLMTDGTEQGRIERIDEYYIDRRGLIVGDPIVYDDTFH